MLGSGAASTVGAFASFAALAGVGGGAPTRLAAPATTVATDPPFELRILGWERGDDTDSTAWIAIDPQWRGAWR